MTGPNDITATMGFESSDFEKAFDKTLNKANRGLDGLKTKTKDGFFDPKSGQRVENQLGALVKGLFTAESALDATALAADRVENSLHSSIGASIAVAAFAAVAAKVDEMTKRWDAFRESGVKAGQDIYRALADDNIPQALDKIGERMKAIREERSKQRGVVETLLSPIRDAITGEDSTVKVVAMQREERRLKEQRDQAILDTHKAEAEKQAQIEETIRLGKKEVEVVELLSEGRTKESKQLQDQIDLTRKANELDKDRNLTQEQRNALIRNEFDMQQAKNAAAQQAEDKTTLGKIVGDARQTPQARQQQRLNEGFQQREDARAIDRETTRMQEASNGKMTDVRRDALRTTLKEQRAQDTKNEAAQKKQDFLDRAQKGKLGGQQGNANKEFPNARFVNPVIQNAA